MYNNSMFMLIFDTHHMQPHRSHWLVMSTPQITYTVWL